MGNISGSITPGAGGLQVNSWGTISGALDAAGDIVASAFNDLTGNITTLGKAALTAWGNLTGAIDAMYNASLWTLGDIASSSIVSHLGELAFTAFGNVQGVTAIGGDFFIHFAGNIDGCKFTSEISDGSGSFTPGPALFYVWGSVTDTTIDVAHLTGTDGVANPFGYVSIIAGGNVTGCTINASFGVDILANGSATGDTIDTSAGAALAPLLTSGANMANYIGTLGGSLPAWTLLIMPDFGRMAALGFGSLLSSLADVVGYVSLFAEKGADATVTSPSCIQVATLHVSGDYTANEIDIDAWDGASLGKAEGHKDVNVFVHGALSGTIDSDNGTVEIEASGDVTATTTGAWSVALKTLGGCTGGSVTSASGPVAVDAYGDVSCPVSGKVYVDVTSDTGKVSGQIDTAGYAKIAAGGGSSSNVNAGGNVVLVSLADVSGTIAAGDGSYLPKNGDPPNIQDTWSADIDAEGDVGGEITAPGEVSVESNGDINAQVTSENSTVELDAAGQIGSSEVQGSGDVVLLGAQGIDAGAVTSQNGAIYARSGNGLTLSDGNAATAATVIAGGDASATVAMSGSAGTVTVTGLGNVSATVNGACATASVSSGGDATVNVQGTDGGPAAGTVNIVAMGSIGGSIKQAGAINLTGWGGVNVTAQAANSIAAVSGGSLQGSYTSGGSASVEALGSVSGSYSAADGGISVVGKNSVDGQISDTTTGSATVASLGTVGASVTTTKGDIGVTAGNAVGGAINAGHDANIAALGGAISGTVNAANNAALLARQGVTQTVTAGQDVSIISFGDVTQTIKATAGSATLNVYGTLSGDVTAGAAASVYADQAQGGITAAGDATVNSKNTIISTVQAGGNASVTSLQGVQGDIQATGAAYVLGIQDVSGKVTTTNGDVTINSGGALSSTVQAGGNASIVSLGDMGGDITATQSATVTGWSGVSGNVTATTGSVALYVNGNLGGATNAGTSATATVVGQITGGVTAGGGVTVSVGGQQQGPIDAGGDVNVTSGGECSGTINAGGNANVESLADITSPVTAAGDISLDTWSDINTATVQAGGSASLSACGNIQTTVTATTGTVDLESLGTTQANATAAGDITLDSLGAVSETTLTSNAGSANVEVSDGVTITVQAAHDASLLALGALDGNVTTTNGGIEAQGLSTVTGTYTAGGDAEVDALGDLSSATVSAGGSADVSTFGNAASIDVSGDASASAFAGGTLSGTVDSLRGEVDVSAVGTINVTVDAGADGTVEGLGAAQADVTSGTDSFVVALAGLNATVHAGGDADLFAGGDLQAGVVAGNDAVLECIGDMSGSTSAAHNLQAAAYGNLAVTTLHADGDITLLWTRGDITGDLSAGGNLDQVESYGDSGATFTAPHIGTVEAFGPIAGSLHASISIDTIESGGDVSATIDSPVVGAILQHVLGLLTDWPATPAISAAAEMAAVNEVRAELQSLADQMAADKSTDLATLPADKAAAAPSYQVSIGDDAVAAAWFQNTAAQMAAQIAVMQAADQQSLAAAQASLNGFFASEDARLGAAKLADQQSFSVLKSWLAQMVADREAVAAADEQVAKDILAAAQQERADEIAKLNDTRDHDWPIMFEKQLVTIMLDRLQTVLDIVGIFDPSPVTDGANALISLARGNVLDAGINGLGMIPYLGDLAKLGKVGKGLGKFGDDGLAALRRVAGDFLNIAAKGAGYANSCEAAATLGVIGRAAGKLDIIGCFVGETHAGGLVRAAIGDPILVQAELPPDAQQAGLDRNRLVTCVIVSIGMGGMLVANRRLRRKQDDEAERALLDVLFGGDLDLDNDLLLDDENLDLLAPSSRLGDAGGLPTSAHGAAMMQVIHDDLPKVAGTGAPAQWVDVPSPRHARRSSEAGVAVVEREQDRLQDIVLRRGVSRRSTAPIVKKRRQSRFGLTWLVGCLCLAACWASWSPSRPAKQPSSVAATAAPTARAAAVPAPAYELRMKPIKDYRLGERFIAVNPLGAEDDPEPDPATWKSAKMRLRKPSGKYLVMELLLSPDKMHEYGVGRAPTVEIDLPEIGISGEAEVLAINPCPEIEPGEGSVVTGTFMHESEGNLLNVFFEGVAQPLGVTENHPFFSLDRGKYVSAGELRSGELLSSGYDGTTARVAYVERRPTDEMVYNLQVNGHHVYHVGPLAVLVHNSCFNLGGKFADLDKVKIRGVEVAHHMPQNAAGIVSRSDGPAIGMTIVDHERTRTFRWRGIATNRADAALTAMQRLMKDIEDIRQLFGTKYDRAIEQMLEYARSLPEFQ
ncbi:MAG TPA: polymorphic toxin-type HINT domain-containing protein [Pirellulales bacterium]|nr:polymorphic toxin-type HINT domain-containing protein [Pirellulales bacterium]